MAEAHQTPTEEIHKIEGVLSILLRLGVSVSLAIVVFGTIVSFAHHPGYYRGNNDLAVLIGGKASFPHTLGQTWKGVREFRGQAIVVVGLLLLICTPVMRVVISIVVFAYEKDWKYVWMTTVVLVFLLISFLLGKAG